MPIGASVWGPLAAGFIGGWIKNKQKSSTTPNYGPFQKMIEDLLRRRLMGSTDLSGYTAQGLQDTNRTFDLIRGSQANDLTARGLGTSPVAGAVDATRENARGAAISRFQNSIPLLQRQLQGDDLGLAAQLFGGRTTTGEAGGGLGGGFENIAGMLGYLQATGAFGRRPGGGGSIPSYPPSDTWGWG